MQWKLQLKNSGTVQRHAHKRNIENLSVPTFHQRKKTDKEKADKHQSID